MWDVVEPTSGFIIDMSNDSVFMFSRNPSKLDIERNPDFAQVKVPGISHPKMQYMNGGAKTISFQLNFFMDSAGTEAVKDKLNWLESCTYPNFSQTDPSFYVS